jgi:hypothetical protein
VSEAPQRAIAVELIEGNDVVASYHDLTLPRQATANCR